MKQENETKSKIMKQNKKSIISAVYVLIAGVLWGCMGLLVRTMNNAGMSAMEVVAFRSVITALVMLIFLLIFKRKSLRIKMKDIWCFIGTGIISIVFFNLCYFLCIDITTLSTAAILLYTAPVFVIVMSFFLFKERFNKKKVIALMLAFIGCILVSGGFTKTSISSMGILTGLGAGFGYALYSIFGRYAIQKGYSTYTITTYTFLFAVIGCVPFTNVRKLATMITGDWKQLLFCSMLTILVTVLPYILYTKGLSGIENSKASIIASIEPVTASVIGFIVFHEVPEPIKIIGMLLVLGSTIICCI